MLTLKLHDIANTEIQLKANHRVLVRFLYSTEAQRREALQTAKDYVKHAVASGAAIKLVTTGVK